MVMFDSYLASPLRQASIMSINTVIKFLVGIVVYLNVAICLTCVNSTVNASTTPRLNLWVTNGQVFTVLADQSTLYIGGDFTYVGPRTGSGVGIDKITAAVDDAYPVINGTVYAAVSDESNGWYIGGSFTDVGGVARNSIAHILSDMSVDPNWDPNVTGANATIYTMAYTGTTLYVGGSFTNIGGQARSNIARLDPVNTGQADGTWNPAADDVVRALVLSSDDGKLYVGGDFGNIGGQARSNIARLDPVNTGQADGTWNPAADRAVNVLLFSAPSTLYIGGDFTIVDGVARNRLAALDTNAATAGAYTLNWDPSAGDSVNVLAQDSINIFAGGGFTSVGGQKRNNLAAFGIQVGAVTSFNPDVNDIVRTMAVTRDSDTMYIGGDFTTVTAQTRNHLAAVNTPTGSVTAWDPNANDIVRNILLSNDDDTLYVAGDFSSFNSGAGIRNYIAAIDTATAVATPWAPDADAIVRTLRLSNDGAIIYAGGDFSVIGQQASSKLAALSTSSGAVTLTWPASNPDIYAMQLSSDEGTLYAGGVNELAAFSTSDTSSVATFNPGAIAGTIETLAISVDDRMLYIGGFLTNIGGLARANIARYDIIEDALTAWDPGTDADVRALALTDNDTTLYTAGDFTIIGTDAGTEDPRTSIAAIPMLPPETTIAPAPGDYTTSQNVTLTCDDNSGSGCLDIYYTLDGGTPTTASTIYTAPINIPIDTAVTLKYFSIDNEGTHEAVQTADFVIDTTAPTTTASPGAGIYNLNNEPINLICTDVGGSGCGPTYYTTDGSTPTTASTLYTGAIPMDTLEGTVTLKFFSIDNAGNQETTINSMDYVVDITPPTIVLSPFSGTYAPPQTITLSCDDGGGTGCDEIYYTTDLTVPTDQSTKYSQTGPLTVTDGIVVRAVAVDVAGNMGDIVVGIYTFTIGAGESRSGVGGMNPVLILVLIGFVARLRYPGRN